MHAIGHKILQKHPQKRVLYIQTSEKFTNELINSIKDGTSAFRQNMQTLMYYLLMMFNFWQIKNEFKKNFSTPLML